MPAAPPGAAPAAAGGSACDTSGATWRSKLHSLKAEAPLDDLPPVDEAPPDAVTLKAEAFAAQPRTEAECLDGIGAQRSEV